MHSVRSLSFKQTIFPSDTNEQRKVWKTTDLGQHIHIDFSLWVVIRLSIYLVTISNDFTLRKKLLKIKKKSLRFLISLYAAKELLQIFNQAYVKKKMTRLKTGYEKKQENQVWDCPLQGDVHRDFCLVDHSVGAALSHHPLLETTTNHNVNCEITDFKVKRKQTLTDVMVRETVFHAQTMFSRHLTTSPTHFTHSSLTTG